MWVYLNRTQEIHDKKKEVSVHDLKSMETVVDKAATLRDGKEPQGTSVLAAQLQKTRSELQKTAAEDSKQQPMEVAAKVAEAVPDAVGKGAAAQGAMALAHTLAKEPEGANELSAQLQKAKAAQGAPVGHLQPLGSHGPPAGLVKQIEGLPSPKEMFDMYASKFDDSQGPPKTLDKAGVPLLMRGAAKRMPAWEKWQTDVGLARLYGEQSLLTEAAKKETRKTGPAVPYQLDKFLQIYNSTDIYSTLHACFGGGVSAGLCASWWTGGMSVACTRQG